MFPKPKRNIDKKYIEWIKSLNCCCCGARNEFSDPHHVNKKGHGGVGTKANDRRAVPLCHHHHTIVHQEGRNTFEQKFCVVFEEIITGLNSYYEENIL